MLTGVHLGGYGQDLEPAIDLCDLLEMIAEQSPVPRIRLSSIDPPEVTPRLLGLMARSAVLCPHLHMPIQAGHDDVLRRMRRQYDASFVRALGARSVPRLPDAAIGTDVIAGFPGETDAQFAAALALLDALPLTYFHVFPYSRRQGTTAAKLPEQAEPACIRRRAQRLRTLGERKRAAFARGFVGATMRVLVEATPARRRRSGARVLAQLPARRVSGAAPDLVNREVTVAIVAAQGRPCWDMPAVHEPAMNDPTASWRSCKRASAISFAIERALVAALTHASAVQAAAVRVSERLEFLGDAVLGLVLSELLIARYPEYDEGRLSKCRAVVGEHRQLCRQDPRARLGCTPHPGEGRREDRRPSEGIDPRCGVRSRHGRDLPRGRLRVPCRDVIEGHFRHAIEALDQTRDDRPEDRAPGALSGEVSGCPGVPGRGGDRARIMRDASSSMCCSGTACWRAAKATASAAPSRMRRARRCAYRPASLPRLTTYLTDCMHLFFVHFFLDKVSPVGG